MLFILNANSMESMQCANFQWESPIETFCHERTLAEPRIHTKNLQLHICPLSELTTVIKSNANEAFPDMGVASYFDHG